LLFSFEGAIPQNSNKFEGKEKRVDQGSA